MTDWIVIVDEEAPNLKIRNKTKQILCANLDTLDEKGKREGVIWGPLGKDDIRELTREQLDSREIRKLLGKKLLEIYRR